jgi:peptide/nickel transport system permease protein
MSAVDPTRTLPVASPLDTERPTRWQMFLRFCRKYPRIAAFGAFVLFVLFVVVAGPYDPRETNTQARLQGPSRAHWFGTDQLGRDIFSRVVYGARVSVPLPMMAVVISAVIGITLGVLSGYYGGWLDMLIQRIVDAQIVFPELVLILLIANTFRPNLFGLMLIIGVTGWTGTCRLARGQVLQAREFEYVSAARATGASPIRVMFIHILPNILNPLIVTLTLAAGAAVLSLATFTFLGIGVQAGTPDWGAMFNDALNNIRVQPWLMFGPGLAVVSTAFAFYMLGDALRDALDPHLRNTG